MQTVIVANGSLEHGPAVDKALRLAIRGTFTIAVDGGGNHTRQLGIIPTLVIGDLDSITPENLDAYEKQGIEVLRFRPEKDETDLELALLEAVERGATWIRVLAAVGNRLDQTIANIYLLALPQLANVDVRIVDGWQTMWLLQPGEHYIFGEPGDTVSLIPFDGDATNIYTVGLEYPLNGETLQIGPARGISNVLKQISATVRFENGKLLVIHTVGRA